MIVDENISEVYYVVGGGNTVISFGTVRVPPPSPRKRMSRNALPFLWCGTVTTGNTGTTTEYQCSTVSYMHTLYQREAMESVACII